eukprot:m.287716 g.287716  ORF g.287716 m.287716 type:complete len:268 (+) comp11836_c0_seq1:56-859(+)
MDVPAAAGAAGSPSAAQATSSPPASSTELHFSILEHRAENAPTVLADSAMAAHHGWSVERAFALIDEFRETRSVDHSDLAAACIVLVAQAHDAAAAEPPSDEDPDAPHKRPRVERRSRRGRPSRKSPRPVCPICGGKGRRTATQHCQTCYSGLYNDVTKVVRACLASREAFMLSGNADTDIPMFIEKLKRLVKPCTNGFLCEPEAYADALPVTQRCKRCRTIATARLLPELSHSIITKVTHTVFSRAQGDAMLFQNPMPFFMMPRPW